MTAPPCWSDAVTAAQLFAVDPVGTGGVLLRSRAGPVRDRWLAMLRAALPPFVSREASAAATSPTAACSAASISTPPAGRTAGRRTRPARGSRWRRAHAGHGGTTVAATAVHVTAAMDAGEAIVERDGLSLRMPARFGVIALDEGVDDEFAPASLRDRLAFHLDLNAIGVRDAEEFALDGEEIDAARARLAIAQGRSSPGRGALHCGRRARDRFVARAAAGAARRLRQCRACGASSVEQDDIALAARLVLAPRALVFPQADEASATRAATADRPKTKLMRPVAKTDPRYRSRARRGDSRRGPGGDAAGCAGGASRGSGARSRGRSAGKAGALQKSNKRGRPAGVQRGELRAGAKLNVIETLRAAAPWQPLRRREAADRARTSRPSILIRKDDFRISRFKQRTETATIFVVDASGSAALHRLAEAKGAVELLLADCYIRRDQVALIAFRGNVAELLLPPTRSLARAKRSLAGLPGGGGTPLAAGLDAAFALSDSNPPQGTDADGYRADRWTRQHRTRWRAGTSARGGRCDGRCAAAACRRHRRRAGRYLAAAGRFRRNRRQGNGRALSAAAARGRRDTVKGRARQRRLKLSLIAADPLNHLLDMGNRGLRLDAMAEIEDQPAACEIRQYVVDRPIERVSAGDQAPAGRDCPARRRGFAPFRGSARVRPPSRC